MDGKKITLKIESYDYIDDDILCVEIRDDRGALYSGSLELLETGKEE